jgi:hypothetical protein
MPNNLEPKNIEHLLAEADELIQKVNSFAIKDMKEEHRLQVEKQAQHQIKLNLKFRARSRRKEHLKSAPPWHARGIPRYCEGDAGIEKLSFLISVKSF